MFWNMRKLGLWTVVALSCAFGCDDKGGSTKHEKPDASEPMSDAGGAADAGKMPSNELCGDTLTAATPLYTASRGSALALTADDSVAVMVNRDSGSVSVFSIEYPDDKVPVVTRKAELPVGGEPWEVAIHPNDDTAFVVLKRDQKLVRIDGLKSTPQKCGEAAIGSEPTSVALSPTGASVWVTNFVDGTLQELDSGSLALKRTVDLNATLVASGLLGKSVKTRPALAHPRSMVITNNGDAVETDESIVVTEFYAQTIAPVAADGLNSNATRAGYVYKVPLSNLKASMIQLPPLPKLGFVDALGNDRGCFPNQVVSMQVQGVFAYAMSTCAGPVGPIAPFPLMGAICEQDTDCPGGGAGSCGLLPDGSGKGLCTTSCTADTDCGANGTCNTDNLTCIPNFNNFRTLVAQVVSVIDVGAGKVLAQDTLNKQFMDYYDGLSYADDSTRRLPLNVFDLSFVPGSLTAYLAASGSDALFKVDYNATYKEKTIDSVGHELHPFIDLTPGAARENQMGRMPVGVVVTGAPHPASGDRYFAFVAADISRSLVTVDLARQEIAGLNAGRPVVTESSAQPTKEPELSIHLGKRDYYNGLGRWSLNGQAWAACTTCHTDGFSDSVSWFAPRGAMQTQNLDGLFNSKDKTDMRVHLWNGSLDEVADHEIAGVRGAVGGIGALVKDTNITWGSVMDIAGTGNSDLAGSSTALQAKSAVRDWDYIIAFIQNLRSVRRPASLDADKVTKGRALFAQGNCAGCHSGNKWTISRVFYEPAADSSTNEALKTTSWAAAAKNSGIPASVLPNATEAMQTMRAPYDQVLATIFYDQLTCALRNVGTYGIAEPGVGVAELRFDMTSPAQGKEDTNPIGTVGYNPPSLLSMSIGAPYLHSGQVRTLEALLADAFNKHHQALAPTFLKADAANRAEQLSELVQFILAIDEDMEPFAIPALGPKGGVLCKAP
jgi:mono/diheme cytochrome c family protein